MKALERTYSKTERIIAKAKFSAAVYFRCVFLALLLGGLILIRNVYADPILDFIADKTGIIVLIVGSNLKAELAAAGLCVLLSLIITSIGLFRKECIVTETKVVYRKGLIARHSIVIPLDALANIEIKQSFFQRIFNMGKLIIMPESGKTEIIKGVVAPDKLMRRIVQQANATKRSGESKRLRLLLSDGTKKK